MNAIGSLFCGFLIGSTIASYASSLANLNNDDSVHILNMSETSMSSQDNYFEDANKLLCMDDKHSSILSRESRHIDNIIDTFSAMIIEQDVDDAWLDTRWFEFLNKVRQDDEYELFLDKLQTSCSYNLLEYIMVFLMQLDYNSVMGAEEKTVVECLLQTNQIQLQELALNTIIEWDKISDIHRLGNAHIKNSYLDDSLKEFIEEHS